MTATVARSAGTAQSPVSPAAGGRAAAGAAHRFRPEIEGLRAVAVLLVVADHLWNAPQGGFLGVDVFFVISGYLITGLLQAEVERRGRISIRGFYARRARRILPAALLVLATVACVSRALFFASRAHDTLVDTYWSAGFLANVHFADIGTDYFHVGQALSPVQHYWSLSVEEQFYVVWPVALMLIGWASRQLRGGSRALAVVVTGVLVVTGFVWSVHLTAANPAGAYFSTVARAWELGVGAVLALAAPRLERLRAHRWRALAVPAGLVLVLLAALTTGGTSSVPAPGAVPAVLGAALVLSAGSAAQGSRWSWPLTNRASRYVGRISYSLYLWHWPVIVFALTLEPRASTGRDLAALLAMAALSVASFHLVEDPIRRGRRGRARPGRRYPARSRLVGTGATAALVAAALAGTSFAVWVLRPIDVPRTFSAVTVGTTSGGGTALAPGVIAPSAPLANAIAGALAATSFPSLSPSLDHLPGSVAAEWTACGNAGAAQLAGCTFPADPGTGPAKKLVVLGDSYGISWLPALRAAQARGYTVYGLTFGECPAADVSAAPVTGDRSFTARCDAHRDWAVREIAALKPDVVVLASVDTAVDRLASGAKGAAAFAQWQAGTERIAARVRAAGAGRIVLLSAPPSTPDLQNCAPTPAAAPGDCVGQVSAHWTALAATERRAAADAHITYVDDHLLFCSGNGYCPGFIGRTPVRADGFHLTDAYSSSLAPLLLPAVLGS